MPLSDRQQQLAIPANLVPRAVALARRDVPAEALEGNPEQVARNLTNLIEAHLERAQRHMYAMAPILFLVKTEELYSVHPERFASFEDWLKAVKIKSSLAYDMINAYVYLLPQMLEAGLSEDDMYRIHTTNLRLLVPTARKSVTEGHPLAASEVRNLIEMAQTMSSRELNGCLKNPTGHEGKTLTQIMQEDEEERIFLNVIEERETKAGRRYHIDGWFSEAQMHRLEDRLRCTWLNKRGDFLTLEEE